jgi:hypothetical protein
MTRLEWWTWLAARHVLVRASRGKSAVHVALASRATRVLMHIERRVRARWVRAR